jgi:thiol-disulfide isomerase/thioredoxin
LDKYRQSVITGRHSRPGPLPTPKWLCAGRRNACLFGGNLIVKKFLLIISLGLILSGLGVSPVPAQSIVPPNPIDRIDLYFFYAQDCQSCQVILQSYLPSLQPMFPSLEFKAYDVGTPAHYEALERLEKRFGRGGSELPVAFIGDQMLAGEKEIMEKLNPLLFDYQAKGGAKLQPLDLSSQMKASEKAFTVEMAYFYQKGCPKCDRANSLLKYLNKKYPGLKIQEIDLNTPDGKRLNETLSNRLNLPPEKRLIAPTIFIGKDYLLPEDITESRLEALIQKYEKMETKPVLEVEKGEIKNAEDAIVERFKSFGVFAILLAGLVEGLNPCALATLVFFISYLTMIGRKRKEILMVGIGFSASSFISHLLLGFGILSFIQHFSFFPLFTRIVYIITFALSLFLGIFSLYDYIQLKRGRPSKMMLQVPNFLKKRIHRIIRTRNNESEEDRPGQTTRFFLAALFIGFIVTLLQSTCTSQVYLPTLLFVTNIPSLKGSATSYLILYNLVYILPLCAIFGIAYWGVTSEQLGFFLQKRATTIKLFTSFFFFFLAGILIVSLL